VIGYMQAYSRTAEVKALKERGITSFAWSSCPASPVPIHGCPVRHRRRFGYKAVLIAAHLQKFLPMLTTPRHDPASGCS